MDDLYSEYASLQENLWSAQADVYESRRQRMALVKAKKDILSTPPAAEASEAFVEDVPAEGGQDEDDRAGNSNGSIPASVQSLVDDLRAQMSKEQEESHRNMEVFQRHVASLESEIEEVRGPARLMLWQRRQQRPKKTK